MDQRHWLLTSTTYGTWLPGDSRGFVGWTWDDQPGHTTPPGEPVDVSRRVFRSVRSDDADHIRSIQNHPHTEYDRDRAALQAHMARTLKCLPIILSHPQAEALHRQLHETAKHRNWNLRAISILRSHLHIVVGVPGDPDPERILGDFKAYGSRTLNLQWGRPASETWWTSRGSTRKLPNEQALAAAIEYVRNQANPLVIWISGEDAAPRKPT